MKTEMSTKISLFSLSQRESAHFLTKKIAPSPRNSESCFSFLIQEAYGPFDSSLSDKDQFPSLYQTATEDSYLVHGVIKPLLHFDWTWVALFLSEDGEKEQFVLDLKAEMVKNGVCVAFTKKLPSTRELYVLSKLHSVIIPIISFSNVYIIHDDVDASFPWTE